MSIAAWLLLFKTELNLITKVVVLFGCAFFYYNPVISRIYCIIVLLVILLVIVWDKREEKPITYAILLFFITNAYPYAGISNSINL